MGEGSYIILFSPSDVTAFHRMKYGGGVLHNLVFSPSDVIAFYRIQVTSTLTKCDIQDKI